MHRFIGTWSTAKDGTAKIQLLYDCAIVGSGKPLGDFVGHREYYPDYRYVVTPIIKIDYLNFRSIEFQSIEKITKADSPMKNKGKTVEIEKRMQQLKSHYRDLRARWDKVHKAK